jgi:hypothetical protein
LDPSLSSVAYSAVFSSAAITLITMLNTSLRSAQAFRARHARCRDTALRPNRSVVLRVEQQRGQLYSGLHVRPSSGRLRSLPGIPRLEQAAAERCVGLQADAGQPAPPCGHCRSARVRHRGRRSGRDIWNRAVDRGRCCPKWRGTCEEQFVEAYRRLTGFAARLPGGTGGRFGDLAVHTQRPPAAPIPRRRGTPPSS